MESFVVLKGELGHLDAARHGSDCFGPMAFLKPVKGIKPLALDLSWRFVFFPQPVTRHFVRQGPLSRLLTNVSLT